MPTNYPTSLDSLTNPTSSDPQNNPSHSGQHANANDAIEAIETFLGTSSAPLPTILDTNGTLAANSDVKIASQKAVKTYADTKTTLSTVQQDVATNYGLSRQAIINGNFDVWQRGTSVANPANGAFLADRFTVAFANTGTLPTTITHSRQSLAVGDIPNSFFHYRIAPNGAGSGFGVNDVYWLGQKIENATRNLAGNGKKITVSFWARSSISNKKLGLLLQQSYGTGGSPTAVETISGASPITLTSVWTKYTATFTTNTLVGKTFGTALDDYLQINFAVMWGSTRATQVGDTAAETFVGAGNIDIAQVQLCAGDVALPFNPKSYEEELRACQRYYENQADLNMNFNSFRATGADTRIGHIFFKSTKRNTNYVVTFKSGAGDGNVEKYGAIYYPALATNKTTDGFDVYTTSDTVSNNAFFVRALTDNEL